MPNTDRDNPNINDPWSIASIEFKEAGNYTVNGSTLTVNDITHNGTGTVTFNNAVSVSGSNAVWRAATGPITFDDAIGGTNSITIEAPQPITFGGSTANTVTGTVIVNEGTLVLTKSSGNAINNILQIHGATARWDAANQVSDLVTSQVTVTSSGIVDLNGKNETLGQLALSGGGRVQSTGGLLTVNGQLGLQDSAEVDLGAGSLTLEASIVRSGSSSSMSRIEAGLITLGNTQNIMFADNSAAAVELEVVGVITGSVPGSFLQKTGTGTLRVTGANTYQGGTTIETGTFIVDNSSGSATGTGSVTVATGATLTGGGAVGGSVLMQNGATITPAGFGSVAIGDLDTGALSMNSTSIAHFQINDGLLTLKNDRLDITGNALLNGSLVLENLNLSNLPNAGTNYTILSATSITGAFANVANGARLNTIDGSGSFVVNYGGASVVLSNFLAAGLAGDYNENNRVDAADYILWRNNIGAPAGTLHNDTAGGTIGTAQYNLWRANFGASAGSGAAQVSAVPEPTIVCMVLMVATMAGLPRRRRA